MRNHQDPRTDPASVDAWAERVLARWRRNPYVLDNHLRPQHEFVLPGTEVYRLEDGLPHVVAELDRRHGVELPVEIPRALDSVRRAGVSSDDLELSEGLRSTLRRVYAEDFTRFGY